MLFTLTEVKGERFWTHPKEHPIGVLVVLPAEKREVLFYRGKTSAIHWWFLVEDEKWITNINPLQPIERLEFNANNYPLGSTLEIVHT